MKKLTILIATAICCCAIASAASISSKGKEEGRSLARIDATLKSYLGNPLTGLVYAASLAIGAISILSMYESPLSPLPVPSLPKPPVGRFPPENPIWPPVAKQPVKLRHSSPYAASNVNPIYSLAPPKVASQEENSWLEGQNLVQNYHNFLQSQGGQQILAAAAAAAASNNVPSSGGSRRQDQLQAAHLQSYINQMSKVPSIRLKSNGQLADSAAPVSHPVKHSTSSSVSEVNSSHPLSSSSSSSLSPSSSSSSSSVSSVSSSSSAAAPLPVDSMQDYSVPAAAAAAAAAA